jgi:molybdenum cofactor synthesis domain-containing protein
MSDDASIHSSTAALLVVGAEVLSGKVVDANGPFLITALRGCGVDVREVRVLPDIPSVIADAVRTLSASMTYVFTTGGIGPTHDDVTLQAVASGLDLAYAPHPVLVQLLQNLTHAYDAEVLARYTQAPQGCDVFWDAASCAPVFCVKNVYVLAGVPSFVRTGFEWVKPRLKGSVFYTKTLFLNVSEPRIARPLSDVQKQHPLVSIGSYPRFDDAPYRLKITLDGRSEEAVRAAYEAVWAFCDKSWVVENLCQG